MITIVHDPTYEGWVFDPTHPTQGRRFIKGFDAVSMNLEELALPYDVVEPRKATLAELTRVHDPFYVARVSEGYSGEWTGQRLDLAELATVFAGGTLVALDTLLNEESNLAIHLPGAKHHAMRDRSSGFCVFADFAMAASIAAEQGYRVAILDIDAHHGDGTEALTRQNPSILTFSIHQYGIFPGTGLGDEPDLSVFNVPLPRDAGGGDLLMAVDNFISEALDFAPDLLFVAGGADGHLVDPLSNLRYQLRDYEAAMQMVGQVLNVPTLFGGAGGYEPDGATPLSWAAMVRGLASTL